MYYTDVRVQYTGIRVQCLMHNMEKIVTFLVAQIFACRNIGKCTLGGM